MAHRRALLVAVLSALCLCAAAGFSATALGARPARAHHRVACAIPSSFHAKGGHRQRVRRSARCLKRRAEERRLALERRAEARRRALRRLHRAGPYALAHVTPSPSPPAGHGNCPDAALEPNRQNIERIRTAVLCLVNRERARNGESPLVTDARLQQAAQSHTDSMAFGDYFEHDGPKGETPLSRMRATGYIYSPQMGFEVGENIGWGTLWEGSPGAVVAAWMASPGHRANILDGRFRNTGVGVSPHPPVSLAHNQPGGIYTQDFGVLIG